MGLCHIDSTQSCGKFGVTTGVTDCSRNAEVVGDTPSNRWSRASTQAGATCILLRPLNANRKPRQYSSPIRGTVSGVVRVRQSGRARNPSFSEVCGLRVSCLWFLESSKDLVVLVLLLVTFSCSCGTSVEPAPQGRLDLRTVGLLFNWKGC